MALNPFQTVTIIAWLLFVIFAIDAFQRKKFNALHFLVFFGGSSFILLFSFDNSLLNKFWNFFWLNRWADLIVYLSIIMLAYLYFELLNKITKNSINTTRIITEQAIHKFVSHHWFDNFHYSNNKFKDYIFLVRCYNEEKTIWSVIDEIFGYWFDNIIIVNDWSKDSTGDIIEQKKSFYKDKNLIILSHLINRGGWAANKTGFDFIKKYWNLLKINWIVTFDADWQMNVGNIDNFIKSASLNKSDIVLGSRFVDWWSASNMPFLRNIILFWSRIVTYIFNKIWVTDPHNWYRLMNLEAIKKINIHSDNMTYASELLDEIRINKLKYFEVPVDIKYTEHSLWKAHSQKNSNAFKILFEIIYQKFFYK